MGELFHEKSCQTYTVIYRALAKAIPNSIIFPAAPLSYKYLQHVITEDYGWRVLEYVLRKIAPNLGGKAEVLQKYIYDLRVISSEDLASFINR